MGYSYALDNLRLSGIVLVIITASRIINLAQLEMQGKKYTCSLHEFANIFVNHYC